ncbi:MAG: hypothetical protein OXG81_16110 [Acidobacteria bacterium]|nr:hypothetical protein [Acidobacteriota bacterium]
MCSRGVERRAAVHWGGSQSTAHEEEHAAPPLLRFTHADRQSFPRR